jgi:hypothetical protein
MSGSVEQVSRHSWAYYCERSDARPRKPGAVIRPGRPIRKANELAESRGTCPATAIGCAGARLLSTCLLSVAHGPGRRASVWVGGVATRAPLQGPQQLIVRGHPRPSPSPSSWSPPLRRRRRRHRHRHRHRPRSPRATVASRLLTCCGPPGGEDDPRSQLPRSGSPLSREARRRRRLREQLGYESGRVTERRESLATVRGSTVDPSWTRPCPPASSAPRRGRLPVPSFPGRVGAARGPPRLLRKPLSSPELYPRSFNPGAFERGLTPEWPRPRLRVGRFLPRDRCFPGPLLHLLGLLLILLRLP